MLVQVCRLHKHLTIPTNGSSLTVHAELIFQRNVGLLHKMFQGGGGGGGEERENGVSQAKMVRNAEKFLYNL